MIRYRGQQYRAAAPAAVINDTFWRRESLLFWIYAVVESKMAQDLPARSKKLTAKTWDKLPVEITVGVGQDADVQQRIMDCISRGMCHYIKIDLVGWTPGVRKGAADVPTVQGMLEWIEQFRNRSVVSGSKLIWAEVGSQTKQPR